jgi:thioesterase domain-containing protein
MTPAEVERYLHEQIPLSRAMQVSVVEIGPDAALLAAPLAPNINHRDTVFGGSAAALATLAAWSLLHARVVDAGIACRLVVTRSTVDYRLPLAGDFTARAELADEAGWERFVRLLERRGKARIGVRAVLSEGPQAAAYFEGEFAALAAEAPSAGR